MKKVIFIFLLLVVSSTFVSANIFDWFKDTFFSPETRQVKVLIKDNLGNPLSGANVKFKIGTTIAFTQTTDSTGYTPYVNLNVGEYYTGEASKTGYSTNTWNIGTIVSGTAWSIGPYVLTSTTPSTRQVKVLIKDNLGNPLSGANVKFKIGTTIAFTASQRKNASLL